MKLKSSYRNVEVLYRHEKKRKTERKTRKSSFGKGFFKIAVISLLAAFSVFASVFAASNSSFFKIKNIKVIVTNDTSFKDTSVFSSLAGKNIFSVKSRDVKKILEGKADNMGVRCINRYYPASISIVLYSKVPVLNVNGEYVVYQDCTCGKLSQSEIAGTLTLQSDVSVIKSAFDIPGLPTIFEWILRHKDEIKGIKYSNGEFSIRLKDRYTIVAAAGKDIGRGVTEYDIKKSVIDLRFADIVLVKN